MNRGTIPGFYYDEQLKKYFKTQPDHIAPTGAKYSDSHVKREERQAKKQKRECKQRKIRQQQTVQRAPSLTNTIGGIGLRREHGDSSAASSADACFVRQLKPSRTRIDLDFNDVSKSVFDLHLTKDNDMAFVGFTHPGGSSSVHIIPSGWAPQTPVKSSRSTRNAIPSINVSSHGIAAFNSALVSMSSGPGDSSGETIRLVACAQLQKGPNLFSCLFPKDPDARAPGEAIELPLNQVHAQVTGVSASLGVGGQISSLWASAVSPIGLTAVASTDGVWAVDTEYRTFKPHLRHESRDVAWLNNTTIAAGHNAGLQLIDTRSEGRHLRFRRRHQLTGIRTPDASGQHLLVSDNTELSLYDVRRDNLPVLTFPHIHQGPQSQFAVHPGGSVVAAVDRDNEIQTYSLRTGKVLGALLQPPRVAQSMSLYTRLAFCEGAHGGGPLLKACHDNFVVNWRFGGAEDDEA